MNIPGTAFRVRGETQILDNAARALAPGEFISLPQGTVHYELGGPTNGQAVVLIPGFSIPYYVWDPTFVALTNAGFRVLRYDLYGRGYSDRPNVVYDADLFDAQLLNLIYVLGLNRPVDIFGLSGGGLIAAFFAGRYPAMTRRLGLIDPAGSSSKIPLRARLMFIPWLGEWLMNRYGDAILADGLRDDLLHPEKFPEYREKYLPQMQYGGFKRAILSSLRDWLFEQENAGFYRKAGEHGMPTLLIWGREDRVVPFGTHQQILKLIPHAQFYPIDGAGHVPHYEQPGVVNPILIKFLSAAD